MNPTKLLRRKPEECPTCRQPIVQPTPSIIAAARVGFAGFGLVAAFLEYRKAVKREAEQAQLAQVYDTPVDTPLDEHLAQREAPIPPRPEDYAPDGGNLPEWPPAHPSLAAEGDASADADE